MSLPPLNTSFHVCFDCFVSGEAENRSHCYFCSNHLSQPTVSFLSIASSSICVFMSNFITRDEAGTHLKWQHSSRAAKWWVVSQCTERSTKGWTQALVCPAMEGSERGVGVGLCSKKPYLVQHPIPLSCFLLAWGQFPELRTETQLECETAVFITPVLTAPCLSHLFHLH